jgi:hypothetical protein
VIERTDVPGVFQREDDTCCVCRNIGELLTGYSGYRR